MAAEAAVPASSTSCSGRDAKEKPCPCPAYEGKNNGQCLRAECKHAKNAHDGVAAKFVGKWDYSQYPFNSQTEFSYTTKLIISPTGAFEIARKDSRHPAGEREDVTILADKTGQGTWSLEQETLQLKFDDSTIVKLTIDAQGLWMKPSESWVHDGRYAFDKQ